MTDKQIIIDGCDVRGCEYCGYDNVCKLKSASNYTVDCKDNPNCYYKQLKRKEQECEELKSAFVRAECQIADDEILQCDMREAIEELKAENDNLKSLIWWIHVGAEGADKATTEYYENRNTPYEENYWKRIRALQPPTYESKYKLALTEIKEIADKTLNMVDYKTYFKRDNKSLKQEGFKAIDQILQKISEVEDEHNG